MRYTFEVTEQQQATIERLGLGEYIEFNVDGSVTATRFDEFEVTCWVLFNDGGYTVERRGLDGDGWDSWNTAINGEFE